MTLYEAIQRIADRIEHGSLSDPKEILGALEEALRREKPRGETGVLDLTQANYVCGGRMIGVFSNDSPHRGWQS